MHIAISGIGGFIGKRVAERALANGWTVTGLESDRAVADEVSKSMYISVVKGDIRKPEDCAEAVKNAQVVIHTAAIVKESGNWDAFRAVNVKGTVNLASAARDAGAKQFIHLSSVMVYGFHYPKNVDEDGPVSGDNNPYCQTKIESEAALKSLVTDNFHYTIIRPGDVYGPGSIPWVVRPLEMMSSKQFMLINDGKGYFNQVYIDNLVDAIFLTIELEAYNKTYTVTDGDALTNKEYFSALADMAGQSLLPSMPSWIMFPVSGIYSKVASWMNSDALVNPEAIKYMLRPFPYSSEKIRNELGFVSKINFKKGLENTKRWLEQNRPDLLNVS
jgi:nucleoside-diphosphate-sugar epimerase